IKELAKILIMDFCDLDSDKWYQYSQKTAFPLNFIYKREATKLLRFEKKINKIFSKSVFVSQKEVDLFLEYYPEARNIEVVANGVDHVFFNPDNTELFQIFPSPMITFCGAMDYYANIDGVIWFTKKILPLIKQVFPDIIFYIVGSNPDASVTSLKKDPAVKITGFVKDTREYYKAADVCVIPLRIARGVQNKVLEAMSMGKPVVSTSHAIQGIQIHSGEYLEIEDDPVEFARKVIDLLGDTERAQNLGKAARSFVIRDYNWETNLQGLYV
ncbi:MAG: glycosyltransferase, partial [Proteobacteria bacterium]|nr:glycosyltransferase [Pseudomonadota bacterium]